MKDVSLLGYNQNGKLKVRQRLNVTDNLSISDLSRVYFRDYSSLHRVWIRFLDDASDYLSLALKYPISAIISKNEKNKNIEIFLEIKSNSKKILIISAEIIDKKNRAITPEIGLNSSNIDRNPNFHSQRGLRWERKTNITDIVLFPYESKSVPFHAVVSMPGVFDLNRYVPYRTVP